MTRYSPEFLRKLRETGGQLPPDPMLAGRPPMTTAAYGARLREQVKAGDMTNAQGQAALNAFIKQQAVMRGAPVGPSGGPKGIGVPESRELPTQSGYEQRAQQLPQVSGPSPSIRTLPGMTPPKSSAPYMPTATAPPPMKTPMPTVGPPMMGGIGAPKTGFQNPPSMQLKAPTGPAPAGPPMPAAKAAMMKKGGKVSKPVKKMAKGGSTASSRGDGCAIKGKTKGRMV